MKLLTVALIVAATLYAANSHAAPPIKVGCKPGHCQTTPPRPPAAPTQPHVLALTDAEITTIRTFVGVYGGEHCGPTNQTVAYCQGAIDGNALLASIDRQLAAEKKPAPAK